MANFLKNIGDLRGIPFPVVVEQKLSQSNVRD